MKTKRYFQNLYRFDQQSETFLIEVSLDDYDDVYDDWDPTPFKKRDIEDEFNDFVVASSHDIPLRNNISINLYLPESKYNASKETALVAAYHNYYAFAVERSNKIRNNMHKKASLYLVLSFIFLTIGYFIADSDKIIFNVLQEGIFIGGWVFLWEFFTNMFISAKDLRTEHNIYKRLFNAEIRFTYTGYSEERMKK